MANQAEQHVVALSGGKDSTALALRLREMYPDREFRFVCTPTGDELPPMREHWARLEQLLGPIEFLPTRTLFDLIEENKALPNFRMRFCTRQLKIEPFFEFMERLPEGSVMYVGIRADEEDRLGMQTDGDDQFCVKKPFLEWGWGLEKVEEYLTCRGVAIPERTDCGCCFYQRLGDWEALYRQYPERYEQYVQLEDRYGHTFRSAKRDTWPADLRGLRDELDGGRPVPRRKQNEKTAACPWCAK